MTYCSIEGCGRERFCRGWCQAHYARWSRHGDPLGGRQSNLRGRDALSRLLARRTIDDNGCWVISGADKAHRYPRMFVGDRRTVATHRWSYEHFVGPVPPGLVLDHLCRNTSCANPEHLEPVTPRENTLRGFGPTAVNAAKTHCDRGHPLTNAYVIPSTGSRQCLECMGRRTG